jgi:hypothetical protein
MNLIFVFPSSRDILLARDSIIDIGIPSSQQVLYSFCNPISLCDQLLNHVLASGVDIDYRVGPKYISPTREGQISSRYMQPNKYFPIT